MDSARAAVLLDQIQVGAVDSTVSLTTVLRKCLLLGGAYGSEGLARWAKRELQGYGPEDELPEYRVTRVPMHFDGLVGVHYVEGQQLASSELPAPVQGIVSEHFEFRHGMAEIEAMARQAHGGSVKLQTDAVRDLAPLVSAIKQGQVERVYHQVSGLALEGVLESARNSLLELVGRLHAVDMSAGSAPTAEAVDQAVQTYIFSGTNQTVTLNNASASAPGAIANANVADGVASPLWRGVKLLGRFVVGVAGILATTYVIWHWP